MARVVLCTFGSLGDLYPFLALGRELTRRGHSCVVATTPGYRERVERVGVEFYPAGPDINIGDTEILRRAMDPRDGTRYILCDLILPYLRESYEQTAAVARGADLIVTHPITLGAYLYGRKGGIRWASVALAPVSMLSFYDMCVFPGFPAREWLAERGPRTQRVLLALLERMFERFWKPYRAFERELGLPHGSNPIIFGQSPQLALALFSPLLAAPQPDWPSNAYATGFPFFEQEETISPELLRFLDSGEAPIVFTLGSSAVGVAGDFFQQSVETARILGKRAVLLTGNHAENQPGGELPEGMIAVPYVPHSAIFPRACVNVHQGGIGTTGEAMRAGRPMLVVPYNHDQPDHAHRLTKLGIARSLRREKYNAQNGAKEIAELLRDARYADRAAEIGKRVQNEHGTTKASDLLEALIEKK